MCVGCRLLAYVVSAFRRTSGPAEAGRYPLKPILRNGHHPQYPVVRSRRTSTSVSIVGAEIQQAVRSVDDLADSAEPPVEEPFLRSDPACGGVDHKTEQMCPAQRAD